MAAQLNREIQEPSWLGELLDSDRVDALTLLRWLDGIDWPDEESAEPHRMLLDYLPLRRQSLPRYREQLASVASKLLRELTVNKGYPPEEISHRALSELFLLCTCLAAPEILADSLDAYYKTISAQGLSALSETPRFSLRLALERNQIDDRLEHVWMGIIRGDERFLIGTWEDGFAALGRSFHALAVSRSFQSETTGRPLTTLDSQQFRSFRKAIDLIQSRLTDYQGGPSEKGKLLEAALDRWDAACPALGAVLRAFVLDVCYWPSVQTWVRETLESRLRKRGSLTLETIMTDAANKLGYDGDKVRSEMANLLKKADEILEEQRLTIITEKRLWNVVCEALELDPQLERQERRESEFINEETSSYSKAELAGCRC
jgi:hypothetical protein